MATVVPDGCRDIIFRRTRREGFRCFVSPLARSAYTVRLPKGVALSGLRLAPGVTVKEEILLKNIDLLSAEACFRGDGIDEFCQLRVSVSETLCCLRSGVSSVAAAAAELGVSTRTLQRELRKETGQSPSFWLGLVRARRCAQSLSDFDRLADAAAAAGYADQSHMTREMQTWFGATPSQIKARPDLIAEIMQVGYD